MTGKHWQQAPLRSERIAAAALEKGSGHDVSAPLFIPTRSSGGLMEPCLIHPSITASRSGEYRYASWPESGPYRRSESAAGR